MKIRNVSTSSPYIKEENNAKILMVQGEPFIMLAGEVQNSNSSSIEYMENVWEKGRRNEGNEILL